MTFVRTVLGDIEPADLGPTYAHEHVYIGPGRIVDQHPDMLLADLDRTVAELDAARSLGLAAVVDALPCSVGRAAAALAEISRRSGVHVIAATGLHLARYYADDHWSATGVVDELATRFSADVTNGIDAADGLAAVPTPTSHRAGVIKIAGSAPALTARDRRVFDAAAAAHLATGVPILTHCSDGVGGIEQVELLRAAGVDPSHVALSHVDKVVDRAYHRELVATGAFLEYDQAFRWPDGRANGTLELLCGMVEDGLADHVLLGLDAARQGYWSTYGGKPGWTYLLDGFADAMHDRGIDADVQHAFFVRNPARAFAFAR